MIPENYPTSMTHGIRKSAEFFFVAHVLPLPSDFFFLKDVQRLALDRFGCDHLPVLGRGLLPCRCGGQSKGMDPQGAGDCSELGWRKWDFRILLDGSEIRPTTLGV